MLACHLQAMKASRKSGLNLLYDKIEAHGFASLTSSERWLFALCWFGIETNGNAIHGFFFNDAGQFAKDVLTGLERVGARQTADIVRRAIAVFPNEEVPVDQLERREVLCGLPDEIQWGVLSRLTDELYARTEDVAGLVKDYIRTHSDEFPALAVYRDSD